MKETGIKTRIREGKTVLGSWLSMGNEEAAEIIASSGFSFVAIDLEHTGIDLKGTEKLIRVIELAGSAPLVRLSRNDPTEAKRVMDCGAHGIIVPMVNSSAEAREAVAAIHYPPRGVRGVGLYRAQKYGAGFQEYKEWLAEKAIVIIQIESRQAMDDIDAILSTEGVDGAIIGPYDLSNSLGFPGELDHPSVKESEKIFVAKCLEKGVAPGLHLVHPDREKLKERIDKGFRLIAYGVDMIFLENAVRSALSHAQDIADREQ